MILNTRRKEGSPENAGQAVGCGSYSLKVLKKTMRKKPIHPTGIKLAIGRGGGLKETTRSGWHEQSLADVGVGGTRDLL